MRTDERVLSRRIEIWRLHEPSFDRRAVGALEADFFGRRQPQRREECLVGPAQIRRCSSCKRKREDIVRTRRRAAHGDEMRARHLEGAEVSVERGDSAARPRQPHDRRAPFVDERNEYRLAVRRPPRLASDVAIQRAGPIVRSPAARGHAPYPRCRIHRRLLRHVHVRDLFTARRPHRVVVSAGIRRERGDPSAFDLDREDVGVAVGVGMDRSVRREREEPAVGRPGGVVLVEDAPRDRLHGGELRPRRRERVFEIGDGEVRLAAVQIAFAVLLVLQSGNHDRPGGLLRLGLLLHAFERIRVLDRRARAARCRAPIRTPSPPASRPSVETPRRRSSAAPRPGPSRCDPSRTRDAGRRVTTPAPTANPAA